MTETCPLCETSASMLGRRAAVHAEYQRFLDPAQCDGRPPAGLRSEKGLLDQAFERRQACSAGHDVLEEARI